MKCNLCHSEKEEKYHLDRFKVMSCRNCGLVSLGEMLEEVYDEKYYSERKEYFFENIIADPQNGKKNQNIDDFAEGLRLIRDLAPDGKDLLDVGCGVGIFLNMARKEKWEVTGVDVSTFATQYARDEFGLDARQGRLTTLALPPESFDVVTMWDTFEHVADPALELKEIRRILKKGGILLLDTPNEESLLRVLAQLLYKMTLGRFRYPVKKLYHMYHLYYFNPSTLTRMVESAGFEVVILKKKTIPSVKARGSQAEKALVKALSLAEKLSGREYELFTVVRKRS
jgi:2-polyprenyl-3-methyl-5-hydroxy-6-metoxy-1,4-benzoquinol methylase